MIKRLVLASALVAAVVGLAGLAQTAEATQEPKPPKPPKVTICHRTNAVKNPYRMITVAQSAVDGVAGNSGQKPDHYGEHQGPIATSEAVAQALKDSKTKWGDIIPPVDGFHSGYNWTAEGQAILRNGCKYVETTPEPNTSFDWVCDVETKSFVATFTNDGDADSDVSVNDQQLTVAPGETKDATVVTGDESTQITVTVDGEVVFNRAIVCIQGQGASGGDEDEEEVESLPVTSGNAAGAAAVVVTLLATATAGGYALRRRNAFNA